MAKAQMNKKEFHRTTEMKTEELAQQTAEFDNEFVADTFHPLSQRDKERWEQLKKPRVYCRHCKQVTKHDIRSLEMKERDPSCDPIDEQWAILACGGCDEKTFVWSMSHDDHPQSVHSEYFPPRGDLYWPESTFAHAPPIVSGLYSEIVTCFNHQAWLCCGAGLRAIIEAICKDKGIDRGPVTKDGKTSTKKDLEGKIGGMIASKLFTETQAGSLHELRFLGNDAAHDLSVANSDQLKAALRIIEHALNELYERPHDAAVLRKRRVP